MNNRLIPLTDGRGKKLSPDDDLFEPEVDSIVLTRGLHGQAWQRWISDGLWHTAGRREACNWETLLTERDLVLVYDAEPRPSVPPVGCALEWCTETRRHGHAEIQRVQP